MASPHRLIRHLTPLAVVINDPLDMELKMTLLKDLTQARQVLPSGLEILANH